MNHFSYPLTIVQISIFEEPQNIFSNQNLRPQTIEPAPPLFLTVECPPWEKSPDRVKCYCSTETRPIWLRLAKFKLQDMFYMLAAFILQRNYLSDEPYKRTTFLVRLSVRLSDFPSLSKTMLKQNEENPRRNRHLTN